MDKSESAEIFWESIGSSGRSFYNSKYVDSRWQSIPDSVRKEISREMNFQQGKINKISYNLTSLILGIVAGAGGIIAGSKLRQHLIGRGIDASRADPAIREALNTTYQIHNQNRKLVSHGKAITFISSTIGKSVDMTGNKLNPSGFSENDEVLKLGEKVTFGSDQGQIVAIAGNYATVLKTDGGSVPIHIKALMRSSDIIFTKSTGMTTWNAISPRERAEILNKCKLPPTYLSKTWQDLIPIAKDTIQSVYGRTLTKEEYVCPTCGDKFGDKDEYEDHKEAHKNKGKDDDQYEEHLDENHMNQKKTIILKAVKTKDAGTSPIAHYSAEFIMNGEHQYTQINAENDNAAISLLQQYLELEFPDTEIEAIKITEIKPKIETEPMAVSETPEKPRIVFEKKYHYHRMGRDKDKLLTDDEKDQMDKADLRTDTTVGTQMVSENGTGQDYQSLVTNPKEKFGKDFCQLCGRSKKEHKEVHSHDYKEKDSASVLMEDPLEKETMTTGTAGVSNPVHGDNKKPKITQKAETSLSQLLKGYEEICKECSLANFIKYCNKKSDYSDSDIRNYYTDNSTKKGFERVTIQGIKQVVDKGQCANCQCIIKDDTDRCPECNKWFRSEDGLKEQNSVSKMREQTDLTLIAREANEGYEEIDDAEDSDKPDKKPQTEKPKTTKKPVGSPNNEGQASTQAYEV